MLIEHRLGDAGGIGNVVHRRLVVAVGGEADEGDVEQLLTAGGGGQSRRHDYPRVTTGPPGSARSETVLDVVPLGSLHRVADDDRRCQQHDPATKATVMIVAIVASKSVARATKKTTTAVAIRAYPARLASRAIRWAVARRRLTGSSSAPGVDIGARA